MGSLSYQNGHVHHNKAYTGNFLIEDPDQVLDTMGISPPPQYLEKMREAHNLYPMRTTKYFLALAEGRLDDPIMLQVLPNPEELKEYPHLIDDPLGEENHSPVPKLIHRYPDRAVLLVTSRCLTRCRHCNRKRFWKEKEWIITKQELREVEEYLRKTPQIREVILSGGDPLTLPPSWLEEIMGRVSHIPSIKVLRLGTRLPVVAPQLVTEEMATVVERFSPLWINLQFNHSREITEESIRACHLLQRAGAILGNQTVLLKGINDSSQCIKELCYLLIEMGVRPYYLFQCDLVKGVEHFRTPVSTGIEIIRSMIGYVSGIATPTFAIDSPKGKGKIPILPDYNLKFEKEGVKYQNYKGEWCLYPEALTPS